MMEYLGDILTTKTADDFYKQADINSELEYTVNIDTYRNIVDLIEWFIGLFQNDFLGCSITPNNTNAQIRIRASHIFTAERKLIDKIQENNKLLGIIEELSIIPLSEHFIIELVVKNLYDAHPFMENWET